MRATVTIWITVAGLAALGLMFGHALAQPAPTEPVPHVTSIDRPHGTRLTVPSPTIAEVQAVPVTVPSPTQKKPAHHTIVTVPGADGTGCYHVALTDGVPVAVEPDNC